MFSHPVSIVGYVLIALGALMGLMSNGQDFRTGVGLLASGAVFQQLGAFLILLGVIAQGFLMLDARLAGRAGSKVGDSRKRQGKRVSPYAADEPVELSESDAAEMFRRQMMEMGIKTRT